MKTKAVEDPKGQSSTPEDDAEDNQNVDGCGPYDNSEKMTIEKWWKKALSSEDC